LKQRAPQSSRKAGYDGALVIGASIAVVLVNDRLQQASHDHSGRSRPFSG
jgi:hypothetical protein